MRARMGRIGSVTWRAAQPIKALASSTEPVAATRMWNFGSQAPSPSTVRPSSPVRVYTRFILTMERLSAASRVDCPDTSPDKRLARAGLDCNAGSPWGCRHVEGDFHSGEGAEPLVLKADRILIMAVEQVVDAAEQTDAVAHVIVGGEVDLGIGRGAQARWEPRPRDIGPLALVHGGRRQRQRIGRLPPRIETCLVLRPAQQLGVSHLVVGQRIGVVRAQSENFPGPVDQ